MRRNQVLAALQHSMWITSQVKNFVNIWQTL